MKRNIIAVKIVLILSIILFLILWPIALLSSNSYIWFLIQKRNGVVLPEKEIKNYNQEIVSFFKDGGKIDFLTQLEKGHMLNVRSLLTKANILFLSSISVAFLFFDSFKNFGNILRKTALAVICLLLVLLVFSLLNFGTFFLKFHQVFFTGNYMFSSSSMLKTLYPDSFFYEISVVYFLLTILGCLTAILISYKLKV